MVIIHYMFIQYLNRYIWFDKKANGTESHYDISLEIDWHLMLLSFTWIDTSDTQ